MGWRVLNYNENDYERLFDTDMLGDIHQQLYHVFN
jgi:hypothetical protein